MSETLRFDLLATDRASAVFDKVGKAAGDTESRFGKATSGLKNFATSAIGQLGALSGIAGIGGLIVSSSKLEQQYSKTMALVGAATGAPKGAMRELDALAMKMGADTAFSANEAADAMLELGKAGISTKNIMGGGLKGTLLLATAGSVDLGTAATIASNAMNTFSLKGTEMNKVAAALAGGANASSASVESLGQGLQQVGPGAKNAGLSLQETVATLSAFDAAGIKGSDAGTSLKTMLARLIPTTEKASDAIGHAGLNFVKANGEFRSITNIAEQLQKKLGPLSEAQRAQTLQTIFGSDATRAATVLMNEGAEGIAKYIKATNDRNAAEDMAKAAMSGTSGAMERLRGAVETAQLEIGKGLAPAVLTLADWLSTKGVPAITGFVNGMREGTGVGGQVAAAFGKVASNLDTIGPVLGVITGGLTAYKVASLAAAAAAAIQAAGTTAATGATWSLNAALRANPIGLVVTALTALGVGLVIAYKKSETFRDIVDGAFSAVKVAGSIMGAGVKTVMSAMEKGFEAVGAAGTWLWNNALQPAFHFIVSGVASILDMWSSMLGALAKVPGFGWAAKAADAMANAAAKAREMADGIQKIPPSKTVYINFKVTGLKHGTDPGRNIGSEILPRGQVETESIKLGELFSKGFAGGVKSKIKVAIAAVSELVSRSSERLQTLRDRAAEITGGVADAMRGALDLSSLGGTDADGNSLNATDQLANFAAQAGQFAQALAAAAGNGINSGLIQKIAQLGPTQGLTAAQALAAMDQAQVASANASMAAVDAYANQLGQTVLTTTSLPEDIAREQGQLDILTQIRDDLRNNPGNINFTINDATDPDKVVAAIRRYIKRNGKLRDVAAD
jgi:TP901 family phage tail tape measure protein